VCVTFSKEWSTRSLALCSHMMKAIAVLFVFPAAFLLDSAGATCTSILTSLTFEDTTVPESLSMVAWETFYVSSETATVTFKDFKMSGTADKAELERLEMTVVPYSDFDQLAPNASFCTGAQNTTQPVHGSGVIKFADVLGKTVQKEVGKAGIYVLLLSHCGSTNLPDQTISGKVRVQNEHGYLSGIDITRKQINGWLACVYCVLMVFWGLYLLKHRGEVSGMHWALSLALGTGVCSTTMFYAGFSDCNVSGDAGEVLRLAECTEVLKPVLVGTYLTLSIMGWGRLPKKTSTKTSIVILVLQCVACISMYIIQDMGQLRHYKFVTMPAIIASVAPMLLLLTGLGVWLTIRLRSNIKQCNRSNSEEALKFFKQVSVLVALAGVMSFVSIGLFLSDSPRQGTTSWYYHGLARDLLPESMMIAFFCGMLTLYAPTGVTARFEQLPLDEEASELTGGGASKLDCAAAYDEEEMFTIEGQGDEETSKGRDGVGAMTIGVPLD